MIDEIFVIQTSGLPLFHFSIHKEIDESDDYILQSSFFTAISSFAQEMANDEIRHIILENKGFALKKVTNDIQLIFGEFTKEIAITKAENQISSTASFIRGFLSSNYPNGIEIILEDQVNHFTKALSDHLIQEKVIPKTEKPPKTAKQQQQRIEKFMFHTLGYKPGQCNIGPIERQRRLLTGLGFGVLAAVILLTIIYLENIIGIPREFRLLALPLPFFMAFQGFYQYFFKFCVTNALKRRYQMY